MAGKTIAQWDEAVGFPRQGIFRYFRSEATTARFDEVAHDATTQRLNLMAGAQALNPNLLVGIQPVLFPQHASTLDAKLAAATYGGGYSNFKANPPSPLPSLPISDGPVSISRYHNADTSGDFLRDPQNSGPVWAYNGTGSVPVLDWTKQAVAEWSAHLTAWMTRLALASHPNMISFIQQDNLFTSRDQYAFPTWLDNSGALLADWDTNHARRGLLLQTLLSAANNAGVGHSLGAVLLGGTGGPRQYWASPGTRYLGLTSGGLSWHVHDRSGLEHSNITNASALDSDIEGIQRFLQTEAVDGRRKSVTVNLNNTTSPSKQRLHLGMACVARAAFWYYPLGSGSFVVPEPDSTEWVVESGMRVNSGGKPRNWLGLPVELPVKVASGRWRRRFEHGTVRVNASGSSWVDGAVTTPNLDATFTQESNPGEPVLDKDGSPQTGGGGGGTPGGGGGAGGGGAGGSSGSIVFSDAVVAGGTAGTTVDLPITVAAGQSALFVVGGLHNGEKPSVSIVGGASLGEPVIITDSVTNDRPAIWRLDSPTAGAKTIRCSWAASTQHRFAAFTAVCGANGATDKQEVNATSVAVTVNTAPGDAVISVAAGKFVASPDRTLTAPDAPTPIANIDDSTQQFGGSGIVFEANRGPAAASPATTTTHTITSNRGNILRGVALALDPPAGSGNPDPVSGVEVVPGDGQITLNWTNPAALDEIIVRYRTDGVNPTSHTDGSSAYAGTAETANVTSLANGTEYTFGFFVRQAAAYSAAVYAQGSPSATPVPPNHVTLLAAVPEDGRITLGWELPADFSAGAGDTIIVRYRSDGTAPTGPTDGTGVTVDANNRKAVLTGLTNGTVYHFFVWQQDGVTSLYSPGIGTSATPFAEEPEVIPSTTRLALVQSITAADTEIDTLIATKWAAVLTAISGGDRDILSAARQQYQHAVQAKADLARALEAATLLDDAV